MREFVVVGHEVPVDPDFPLDDLAGGAGRLDILCRCVAAAFLRSHGLRTDVRVHLVVQDRLTLRFDGAELRYLSPEERNVASLIRHGLAAAEEIVGRRPVESTPGITVANRTFAEVIDGLEGTPVELHEDGDPVVEFAPPDRPAFVLSDHRDFSTAEADRLASAAAARVRLGPERLHADHAITIAHNFLDTEGYTVY